MVWTAFEIAINCVQGLLTLMFVKQCFACEKRHPSRTLRWCSVCGPAHLPAFPSHAICRSALLRFPRPSTRSRCPPAQDIHCILADRHDAALQHDFGGDLSHLELLPQITRMPFPSVQAKRFVSIIVTNIALFAVLKLLILIKKGCSVPGTSSCAAFMITLSAAFLVEESLYSLFLNVSDETIVPFF
ncbi:MAG: hypothetical protein V8Q79_05910 [Christensenellales bacterium]